ncbi:hypothetical protein LSH36_611g03012 [Paralvinella palmiformis]|uniref:Uncharacterized protein n=1 Tax=Paralvinella palmiformis TaxID=53620 RepID=A0AAD9J5B8_9ANNE|nr:hypothetical protein LSH36_611g03012 [Paralvinella palmiformis]
MKVLVAFDFDHTIIDDNSDLYVRKLAPDGKIPAAISELYNNRGWTEYMAAIFKYLHENQTTSIDIEQCMLEIPFVDGMKELFSYLDCDLFDVIIVSDSNSVFIDFILRGAQLHTVVHTVYTNPAYFNEEDCLKLDFYHTQDWCDLSTVNLCKGHILESHIKNQKKKGILYDIVAFVGDGTNDLCPCLRLKNVHDLIFPRVGFSLIKKIEDPQVESSVVGKVIPWRSGFDIISALKQATETK